MATMNISVTDKMRAWVEAKVEAGDYATSSDCMRDLLRQRIDYEEKLAALRREIQKGFDSGVSDMSWQDIIAEVRGNIAKKRASGA